MKPWEEYQQQPTATGPWTEYQSAPESQPKVEEQRSLLKGNISDIPGLIFDNTVKPAAKVAAGIVEPLAKLGGGALGKVAGDAVGLATLGPAMQANFLTKKLGLDPKYQIDPLKIKQDIQSALTYEPRTDAGKNPNNPINFAAQKVGDAIGGLANRASEPIRGDGSNPLRNAAADGVQEAVPQAIGLGTIPLGKVLTNAATAAKTNLATKQATNSVKDVLIKQAVDAGLKIPPNGIPGAGIGSRSLNSFGGKAAANQLARFKNEGAVDKLSREQLGVPPTAPLNEATIKEVIEGHVERGYKPIEQIPRIATDQTFKAELQSAISKNRGSGDFPKALNDQVANEVSKYAVKDFSGKGAIEGIRQLRARANELYGSGTQGSKEVAGALKDTAKALETQVERHLSKTPGANSVLDNYLKARKGIAQASTYGEAIKEGTGNVSSSSLASALNKGKPLEGNQRLIAEFYNEFGPQIAGKSAVGDTASFSLPDIFSAAGGTGLGSLLTSLGAPLGPLITGLSIGAPVGRIGSRNFVLSKSLQERLANPSYTSLPANFSESIGKGLPLAGLLATNQDRKK